MSDNQAVDQFKKVLAEVKHTNATNTRNASTDWRCRDFFTEYGDDVANIIDATPDILEALQRLAEVADDMGTAVNSGMADEAIIAARAAIAKTKGRSTE